MGDMYMKHPCTYATLVRTESK